MRRGPAARRGTPRRRNPKSNLSRTNDHLPRCKRNEIEKDTLLGTLGTLYRDFVLRTDQSGRLEKLRSVNTPALSGLAAKVFEPRYFHLLFSGNTRVIRNSIYENGLGKVKITQSGLLGDIKK